VNVTLFTHALVRAGTERQVVLLARELATRGHDVTILVLAAGGPLERDLDGTGVRIVSVSQERRARIASPFAVARAIRRLRPDVVYSFLARANVLAVLARPLSGRVPVVMGIRGERPERTVRDPRVRLLYSLEAWLSRHAEATIANSVSAASWARERGFPADRLSVIHNGIAGCPASSRDERAEIRSRWQVTDETVVIGRVGGLRPIKGWEVLLDAAKGVMREHAAVKFVMVGGGPRDYAERLKDLARSLGIDGAVIWEGPRDDVELLTQAFDIAVSPSLSESFPNAVAEAMVCGVPCVATNTGESADIVGDPEMVIPPSDPDALAGALLNLVRMSSSERQQRGAAARERVTTRFGLDAMIQSTLAVLGRAVSGERGGERRSAAPDGP